MSLFWNKEDSGQTLAELSNSKNSKAEEQTCWGYYGLSILASIENQVRPNICSASLILWVQGTDQLFCVVLFLPCFSESVCSVYYRNLLVILWLYIRSVLASQSTAHLYIFYSANVRGISVQYKQLRNKNKSKFKRFLKAYMKEYFLILNGIHIHTIPVLIQIRPNWKKWVKKENLIS